MKNQKLYEDLLQQVNGRLNYQETQSLKTLNSDNIPVLEKKMHQLDRNGKMARVAIIFVLLLVVLSSLLLQLDFLPKLHQAIITLLMVIPASLGGVIFGKNSMSGIQRDRDIIEMMLILMKDENQVAETKA